MKTLRECGTVVGLIAVLALGACATRHASNPGVASPTKFYSGIGVVQSIQIVRQDVGDVDRGEHDAENIPRQTANAYKFSVHMDDDSDKTIVLDTNDGFAVGDCVQVHNKILQRCGHSLGE